MSLHRRLLESRQGLSVSRANGPWENKRPGLAKDASVIPPEHILAVVVFERDSMPEKLRAARYFGSDSTGIRDALRLASKDYAGLRGPHGAGAVRTAISKLIRAGKLEDSPRGHNRVRIPLTASEKAAVAAESNAKDANVKLAMTLTAYATKKLGSKFVRATRRGSDLELTVLLDLTDPGVTSKIDALA